MTELTKYIGPDLDVPSMGYGVGLPEVGEEPYDLLTFHGTLIGVSSSLSECSTTVCRKMWYGLHGNVYVVRCIWRYED